jgi:hypothetical protein
MGGGARRGWRATLQGKVGGVRARLAGEPYRGFGGARVLGLPYSVDVGQGIASPGTPWRIG